MKWNSKITKVEPNHLLTRGYRQDDLIGNISFSNVIYLLLKGNLPSVKHGKMIDAILTSCIDHGVTPPSAMASRIVASGDVPLPTAVAAGIMSVGDAHGGAIEKGARFMQKSVKRMKDEGKNIVEMSKILVNEAREKHERILGFGHRVHSKDPRAKKLFELAEKYEIADKHVELAKEIEKQLEKIVGKKLPVNVDGAISAIISDMDFDWRLGKAFFIIGRIAGLTAHVYEEKTDFKPMRKMFKVDVGYDGAEEKGLPE